MIDLQKFCSRDPARAYLMKPFSRGAFSYATNGHIAVRVARRDDVPEADASPDVDKVFPNPPATVFLPFATTALPTPVMTACESCFDGVEHACPGCSCVCDVCFGSGEFEAPMDVLISGVPFALKYVRMLAAMPGITVASEVRLAGATEFHFDGGEIVLMPLNGSGENRFDTDLSPNGRAIP